MTGPGRLFASALLVAAWAVSALAAEPGVEVLGAGTSWRCHTTWAPELVGTASDARPYRAKGYQETEPPPRDWRAVDFDDADWWRTAAPVFGEYGFRQPQTLALLCLRAAFAVDDPDAVSELHFSATFRGGAALYVNGREIARAHLPGGKLTPDTPADDYPRDVFLTPEGARIGPTGEHPGSRAIGDRLAGRLRRITGVAVPAGALRPGKNVLALEIHRAVTAPDLPSYAGDRASWNTCGLLEAALVAETAQGLQPNVGRPDARVAVWNAGPLQPVAEGSDYPDPFAVLWPVRLVATRNAACSGQVVVSSRCGLLGIRGIVGQQVSASMGPFAREGGPETVPTQAVRVRYASRPRVPDAENAGTREIAYADILTDQPTANAPVVPVWVTVEVPPDQAPGRYRGTLTVRPGVLDPIQVPVHLTVCPWRMPDPREWATWVALIQSPESVAIKYNVPLWSEDHWRYLERSLALLGRVGNKVAYATVLRQTHFGNSEAMIRFRKGPKGAAEPDFSVFDRYMDLYARHVGPPAFLCVYVWEPNLYSRRGGRAETVPLTLVDADGRTAEWTQPIYGSPGTEPLWRAVMDGVRDRVKRRGWPETAILLGCGADNRPHETTARFFRRVAPYARWTLFTHGRGDPRPEGPSMQLGDLVVGYLETPGEPRPAYPLGDGLIGGWDSPFVRAGTHRAMVRAYSPLATYRSIAAATLGDGYRGFCRFGFDFWEPGGTADARGAGILGRYHTNGTLDINLMRDNPRSIVAAGVEGAVGTVRFEMLREGIQECEAQISIERALADEARRARLGEDLVRRCRETLQERLKAALMGGESWEWFAASDWQGRSRRLFGVAGEVSAAGSGVGQAD